MVITLFCMCLQNGALPSIFEVLPYAFNPKEGLIRMEEFSQVLRDDDDEQDNERRNINPKLKKKKSGSRKLNKDDIFKRQLKAAKDISATCRWVINEVEKGRIRNTLGGSFEASHFSGICVTQGEMKWLQDHDSEEKVLSEVIFAYSNAPKWEPFPKISLSLEDLQRIEEAKKKYAKEVEEAKKLAQALLVRLSDNVGDNDHQMEYGEGSTEWITAIFRQKRQAKSKAKNPQPLPAAAASNTLATSSTSVSVVIKCSVTECTEPLVEGRCGNSGCSEFRFCSLHLGHNSHMWQPLQQAVSTNVMVVTTICEFPIISSIIIRTV